MENQEKQEIEVTGQMVTEQLKRLFNTLRTAFSTQDEDGGAKAFDLIKGLADMVDESPTVVQTIFTEQNLAAFSMLQEKSTREDIGIEDIAQAFPEMVDGMKAKYPMLSIFL
jgi:hypothetical protein